MTNFIHSLIVASLLNRCKDKVKFRLSEENIKKIAFLAAQKVAVAKLQKEN